MTNDRDEEFLRTKLTDGLHPAEVDLSARRGRGSAQRPPGMALAAYRPLPGCAAVDCSRSTGRHSRIYEPAGNPRPLLAPEANAGYASVSGSLRWIVTYWRG